MPLQELFREFAEVSGLQLNLAKTIVIPLGCETPDVRRERQAVLGDPWDVAAKWAGHGKYLGFMIGPSRAEHSWDKPLAKYRCRVNEWKWSSLGLHLACRVYNMFVLPTLLFIAQLEEPPSEAFEAERWAMR